MWRFCVSNLRSPACFWPVSMQFSRSMGNQQERTIAQRRRREVLFNSDVTCCSGLQKMAQRDLVNWRWSTHKSLSFATHFFLPQDDYEIPPLSMMKAGESGYNKVAEKLSEDEHVSSIAYCPLSFQTWLSWIVTAFLVTRLSPFWVRVRYGWLTLWWSGVGNAPSPTRWEQRCCWSAECKG